MSELAILLNPHALQLDAVFYRMPRSSSPLEHKADEVSRPAVGDRAHYDELYRLHHARVLRLCRLLLTDSHEAEDVSQEVFLKLFQTSRLNDPSVAWGAWLTRVAVNACHDRRRSGWWKWWRDRHVDFIEDEIHAATRTPEDEAAGNETRTRVWRSFRQLPARQQQVFVLRQIEGWPTNDVADLLGLTPGTVKRHLYRAVHRLRGALGAQQRSAA